MSPIRAEAIRTLYLQLRTSSFAAAIVTAYMVGTAWMYTGGRVIAGWLTVQVATQMLREILLAAWRRRRGDARLAQWARAYTAYMALAGLVWGSTIFLFSHPAAPITVALTLCGLYGISAGSVPGNAYNPPGLFAFVGFIFASVLVRLLATRDIEYAMLALASAGFALIMMGFCRVQARTILEGLRIRFDNRELLDALTIEKGIAEEARRKAELANMAKSQFLAAASHDLRQPLYALSLFSASLDELRLDAGGRTVVRNIQESIATMETLFNGLLDISRLEAGVVRPRITSVSIDELFDRLSQYFLPVALDSRIDLRFRANGEWVRSDAMLLEQVLANLVANALRWAMGGSVLVAAQPRADHVRLSVWDTGIGIAAADLDRIFEEFVQLQNAERDRTKGLGLGLSIARHSAALIEAEIHVASRPGLGSRFAFSQPTEAAPDIMSTPIVAVATSSAAMPFLPILIVEDDHIVRLALQHLLERWGVRFDAVAGAAAALDLIGQNRRYALVVADHRLGGEMDGLSLITAVAARLGEDAPRAALVTADFDPALLIAAAAAGVPVLHKPVDPGALRRLIETATPLRPGSGNMPI